MLNRLRQRLTYANVMATLGVFLGLGGTAWAVAANSVGTAQLKNGAVTNPKLAANSVGTRKVFDNSLTGSDINESTLGTTPNSARVGGLSVQKFDYVRTYNDRSGSPLFTVNGLTVTPECGVGDQYPYMGVSAKTATNGAEIYSAGINTAQNNDTDDLNRNKSFGTADRFRIVANGPEGDFIDGSERETIGQTRYRSASGQIVSIDWTADMVPNTRCRFFGTVTAG